MNSRDSAVTCDAISATMCGGIAAIFALSRSGACGRRFKSGHPDQLVLPAVRDPEVVATVQVMHGFDAPLDVVI